MLSSEKAPINRAKSLSLPKWSSPMHDVFRIGLHNPSSRAKKPAAAWCWGWLLANSLSVSLSFLSVSGPDPSFVAHFLFCLCFGLGAGTGWHPPAPAKPSAFMAALSIKAAGAKSLVAKAGSALSVCQWVILCATRQLWLRGWCDWHLSFSALPGSPRQRRCSAKNSKPSELSLPESAWGQCYCDYSALCPGSLQRVLSNSLAQPGSSVGWRIHCWGHKHPTCSHTLD